jgi:hypothetical protein
VCIATPEFAFHVRNGVERGLAVPSRNQQNRPNTPSAMYLFLHVLFERGPNIVQETEARR